MDKGKSIITKVEGDDERESLSLPPGYRFAPTDTELVVHYLCNKVYHKPLPRNRIRDVNIYLFHPQQLVRMYPLLGEIYWYFFTPRERKYRNGIRPNRATSDGYWKAKTSDKPILYENNIVGYKMSLNFYEGGPRDGKKTEWKMHEYKILPTRKSNVADSMKLDDLVLCKIYSTSKKAKDVQENKRTELAAENANQYSNPLGVSNGMNMEERSSPNLLSHSSDFLLKPLDGHHMPLVGSSMSFPKFSGVQIQNPSILSSGDNDQLYDLTYLNGLINGSSNDNFSSSLGAHMMHIEEWSSPNLRPHNSDFLLKPLDGHHMPLVGPSMSFSELSGVQVSNPSLPSGDNDQLDNLMYLKGAINGTSHDNCPSSLGAHMMNIEERSSPNLLSHNSERHRFMLKPVDDQTSPLADPSMSFPELSEVQIQNPSLLSSCDNDQLMNDLIYLEGIINDSSHDNCPSSVVPI